MELVDSKKIGALSELDFEIIHSAYRELIKTQGWKYLVDDINKVIEDKQNMLINISVKAENIREINQLGRDIQLYRYFISIPNLFIENAERVFKRKEK